MYVLALMPYIFHIVSLRPDSEFFKSAEKFSQIPDSFR